jgi:transposase
MSGREAAKSFSVGVSSAIRWGRRDRETGGLGDGRQAAVFVGDGTVLDPCPAGGHNPDLTLRALLSELRGRGITVSYGAVWNIVPRAGKSFKKRTRVGGLPVAIEAGGAMVERRGADESFLVDLTP